ncbi:hypothetical protein [Dokdonia sp.]|uniref:hypothetical protein n=1 Tax=Dokdonia sp. TaxID=2024995 RepID=UPI0032652269
MNNIIFIEDDISKLEDIIKKITVQKIVEYTNIYPRILNKSNLDFSDIESIENFKNLKSKNYSNDFLLLKDVYKKINDTNRENVFNKIIASLYINNDSLIFIDVALKGNVDDEGLKFYNYLMSKEITKNAKCYIISVAEESTVIENLKEINESLKINHIQKDGSGAYEIDIIKKIMNG